MDSRFCCDCGIQLPKTTARFCPNGHSQSPIDIDELETKIKTENNEDRHTDDDSDIQIVSPSRYTPSLRSQLPVGMMKNVRNKAIQRDSNRKIADSVKGSYGIRPSNDNSIRKTVVIWLCERPPTKPHQLGISITKKLESDDLIGSATEVDIFVRKFIEGFPAVNEHKDISSGELVISKVRKAYIGKMEGNICAFYPIWDDLKSIKQLPSVMGEKDSLHLCLPVDRVQTEVVKVKAEPGKRGRRTRVESLSDINSITKRPRSGTRSAVDEYDDSDDLPDNPFLLAIKKEEEKAVNDEKNIVKQEKEGSVDTEEVEKKSSKRQVKKPARYVD
jgi:hypothetical protein